ncbi:hypothetical protein P7L79_01475 (plasmid) [Tistrella mobilis]
MEIRRQPEGLTITLPDELVAELGFEEGDPIDVRVILARTFEICPRPKPG